MTSGSLSSLAPSTNLKSSCVVAFLFSHGCSEPLPEECFKKMNGLASRHGNDLYECGLN